MQYPLGSVMIDEWVLHENLNFPTVSDVLMLRCARGADADVEGNIDVTGNIVA